MKWCLKSKSQTLHATSEADPVETWLVFSNACYCRQHSWHLQVPHICCFRESLQTKKNAKNEKDRKWCSHKKICLRYRPCENKSQWISGRKQIKHITFALLEGILFREKGEMQFCWIPGVFPCWQTKQNGWNYQETHFLCPRILLCRQV